MSSNHQLDRAAEEHDEGMHGKTDARVSTLPDYSDGQRQEIYRYRVPYIHD